jgi:hypothetical protein
MLIEAAHADEYARDAGLRALAWLTATGRIDRAETADYLRDLSTALQPQAMCFAWVGWQHAIALLGLEDLVPLVEAAFDRGFIDMGMLGAQHFHKTLAAARQAAEPTAVFERHVRDVGRLDSAVAHLSGWAAFQSDKERRQRSGIARTLRPASVSVRNPIRDVGRNDPCPCGSGKKFKKCCLGKAG